MAKAFERISLATKFRILFAGAVLAILAAALGIPWYFTERLMDAAAEEQAEQIARLGLAEWMDRHQVPASRDRAGAVARYFTAAGGGRRGPRFIPLTPLSPLTTAPAADVPARRAMETFRDAPQQRTALTGAGDEEAGGALRCFTAVRATASCRRCHDGVAAAAFQPDQLVGMIDLSLPSPAPAMGWWTRAVFAAAGALAGGVAFLILSLISRQIILSPVRKLRVLADNVAEGDLSSRCDVATGDEFEHLGRRFNEMLDEIKRQQDRLRQANRALDLRLVEIAESNVALYEANRIKTEFLANVSHELRTPLNSIIGFAELLSETDDEKRRRHATHILTSARMLLGIINDLLDVTRIEAGRAEVRREKVSIRDLCETLGHLVGPMADQKHLRLSVAVGEDVPVISTDPGKAQQILYNLLSNAIKFTPADGQVTLSAAAVPAGDSPLRADAVAVAVADTGPGISSADQELIFDKFHRLDGPMRRETPGTGLGLAISKDLTNLLGGKLTLQSEPGHGTTFTVVLPVVPPEPGAPADGGEVNTTR